MLSPSSTQITATWGIPADRGCPEVRNYVVTYSGATRMVGCSSLSTHSSMYTTPYSGTILSSVKPYYSYTIGIKAVGGPAEERTISTGELGEYLSTHRLCVRKN